MNIANSGCSDGVRQNRPTGIDALRSAIKLEEKLAEFHMDSIAMFVDESYKKLLQAMMKADYGHLENIRGAYQEMLQSPLPAS